VFLNIGHPVEEIRLRALENLQSKLDLQLISDVDILQYKYLYIKLLEWFNFPSPPRREIVLDIILKLSKVKFLIELIIIMNNCLLRMNQRHIIFIQLVLSNFSMHLEVI
jgi:hypothetical protein